MATTPGSSPDLKAMLAGLQGLRCWHVNAGGSAGTSFSLSLGEKIRRKFPLKNSSTTAEFREYQGEATLLIWCSWRLDGDLDAKASSDESADVVAKKLACLIGQNVREIEPIGAANDLRIAFDNDQLVVFCDHVPGDPSFDGNWQIEHHDRLVVVGPGYRVHEEYP